MYQPDAFRESRPGVLHALIRRYPFATLAHAAGGEPGADYLPLLLDEPRGLLRGHLAMGNPLCRHLDAGLPVLAVFQGPQGYISPRWYPTKAEHGRVAPTWNYAVVQVRGQARAIRDRDWLLGLVEELTRHHEAGAQTPWRVADAPADYVTRLLGAIVGVEIAIDGVEGKWKMSQNQPAANRLGVIEGLRERGADGDHALADLVALGLDKPG